MAKVTISLLGEHGGITVELEDSDHTAEILIHQAQRLIHWADAETFPDPGKHPYFDTTA